jgi:UDP-2,4-diacetamido-2,4,6-trideoxy-beta-L-altropyranose hydrolase
MVIVKKIVFCVNGNKRVGMGHVKRCLALSEYLKATVECEIVYLMQDSDAGESAVSSYGYETINEFSDEKVDVIVTSLPQLTDEYMAVLRANTNFLICLDDSGRTSFSADLVVRGSIVKELRECDPSCKAKFLLGQDFMVLDKQFKTAHDVDRIINENAKSILVTMGGSDINNFTALTMNALEKFNCEGIEIKVVVGPAFEDAEKLMLREGFKFKYDIINMAELMMGADIIIAGGGMTLYELACVGTPAIVLCQTDYQVLEGQYFEREGVVINAGEKPDISEEKLIFQIESLVADYDKRKEMSLLGKRLIDGKAIDKITEEIQKEFEHE